MREIKFRIICEDASGKTFILYRAIEDFFNSKLSGVSRIDKIIKIDLFTGIHDKYGVEIHEGDRCADREGNVFNVVWSNNLASFLGDYSDSDFELDRYTASDIEVIGNIHEPATTG
jgi:hypothetical protein